MPDTLNSMADAWKSSQLTGANSAYLESIYEDYLADPASVESSWRQFFDQLQQELSGEVDISHEAIRAHFLQLAKLPKMASGGDQDAQKLVSVMDLIYAYRFVGHRRAKIDPLGLQALPSIPDLTLAYHSLSDADLNTEFDIRDLNYAGAVKLKDIVAELERIYCDDIGTQYMHITTNEEKTWIRSRIETNQELNLSKEKKINLYKGLVSADGLEKYLGMKYVGQKRFSLEGGDAFIPMLNYIIAEGVKQGTQEVVMGMAHRGRLNALVNVIGKSPEELMDEFEGKHSKHFLSGDVKYHNGFSTDVDTEYGPVHLAMAFNPSHLEIVSPVVCGSVRARQDRRHDNRSEVLPITIHGDSAFAGQGVVMETLNLSQLRGFRTGGTIHIVINNQVGFTTSNPQDVRSSTYCTDVAKMIEAPIFHVNADHPEAVLFVAQIAIDYRMKFNKDVVIDLVCYRLHGHNESDEPTGTQPIMYQAIKKHKAPYKLYAEQLVAEGVLDQAEADALYKDYRKRLEAGKPVVNLVETGTVPNALNWGPYLGVPWDVACSTAIPKDRLLDIAKRLDKRPDNFPLQKQVEKALNDRAKITAGEMPVNWGYAELMAYATLLEDGYSVRLDGQDAGRGTFSHRHAVLHNYSNNDLYLPLANLSKDQPRVDVIDSALSEEAVMAYEYGYACSTTNSLVVWEAQFGDFANGAQVVIDQFICSGEEKWGRMCGLALFLPHGQEGMGSEHSSARLERFLQLCANENMQVCVPTTPAQMYHMMRRQMVRPYRKPLVVMTPKSLLRHPLVTSSLDDLADGHFHLVIDEQDDIKTKKVNRLVLCQGKVYYDLLQRRRDEGIDDIALVRIEQLYPFPAERLAEMLENYRHVDDIVWCQEEPVNQGAWYTIQHPLRKLLGDTQTLGYAGREAFSSPAVGYPSLFKIQQEQLVCDALKLKKQ